MTSYARFEIVLIVLVGGALTALAAVYLGWWALVPGVPALALLSFYRDPPRRVPESDNLILAPADGKIVEVTRDVPTDDDAPLLRIMIFLSVLDVHINRSPCAGRVENVAYQPGEFLNALRPEADTRNENNTVTIVPAEPLPGPIRVRQIAGVLARRIVCRARPGDRMAAGERFGMIKLGSRTEVVLRENPGWEICVTIGDKVKAGSTILARLHSTATPETHAPDEPGRNPR